MVLRKSVMHWDRLSKKRRTVISRAVCAEIAQVCCGGMAKALASIVAWCDRNETTRVVARSRTV